MLIRHRAGAIGRRAAAAIVLMGIALSVVATRASDQAVTWTDMVNVTAGGDVLQKTAGCDGCEDAGAASQSPIAQGDGYVEFTVGETDTFWVGGLSHADADTTIADIDFAFRFNGAGWADVLESGIYQSGGDTPYAVGDVFRVAVVGGKIQYSRNGTLLRESQTASAQYPLLLDVSLGSLGTTVHSARIGVADPPPPGGGFIEKAGSPALRPRLTRAQIEAFLPANLARGAFTFPAPYNTTGIRLTNASDCGGQDCLWYVGYSYWRNINNHAGSNEMLIMLGMDRNAGGAGPSLIAVDKTTDQVVNRGPLFDPSSPYSYSTGEGWYFSAKQQTKLYVYLVGGATLWRYDVISKTAEAKPALDLTQCKRPDVCPSTAMYIFQPHSSDDDVVHSATVQDSTFARVGCVAYHDDTNRFQFFAPHAGNVLDECHVDKSGRWLLILEGTPSGAVNNSVVDLNRGTIENIDDTEGALGHLDMGFGYAVGADNWNPMPNATILLRFPVTPSPPILSFPMTPRPIGQVVHFNKRWDIAAANHIAHGNARADAPPETQFACGSNASRVADMADEIVCFSLDANRYADGSLDVLVVAPVMTDLDAAGGRDVNGDDYPQFPKGNLDVTGEYFIWTTNMGGDRLDAFLVKVPVTK
jgi:hypothetical protein